MRNDVTCVTRNIWNTCAQTKNEHTVNTVYRLENSRLKFLE